MYIFHWDGEYNEATDTMDDILDAQKFQSYLKEHTEKYLIKLIRRARKSAFDWGNGE